jgi:erythronate-4-phosphate dehydrogenase
MKIVADENIPCVEQAFSTLGDVTLLPGRSMRAEQVRDADILLVRSVTRIGRELLEDSRVRFVGSATIGFDHVDREYLQAQGTGFSTAPGSNAASAAEYVVSALMVLAEQGHFNPAEKSVGIIGCGNVGSRVLEKLSVLGIECRVNDPPLKQQGGHEAFVGLDEVLQADIISVHVPLTREGRHPTFHLVNEAFLKRLKPGAIFINTSRGAVVDNTVLNTFLAERGGLAVVLDVWEGEPAINAPLLEQLALGTPHIAGYALDGKMRGTEMIYQAACEYFDRPAEWRAVDNLPAGESLEINGREDDSLSRAVLHCYDVRDDDRRLRRLMALEPEEQSLYFDRLRKEYPVRREFSATTVRINGNNETLRRKLQGLGFDVVPGA